MAMQDSSKEYGDLFRGIALNISFDLMQKALYDHTKAEDLGLKPDDLKVLSSLNPLEYSQVVREISLSLVALTVNTGEVNKVLESFLDSKRQRELISELLRYGASNDQVRQWFNLSYRQLRDLRKELGFSSGAGKNRSLSQEEIESLSTARLSRITSISRHLQKDALSCLAMSKASTIPISQIGVYSTQGWSLEITRCRWHHLEK